MEFAGAVDKIISEHLAELTKPGVLSIRPGYQAAGQWLTKKPAIVVTVDQKQDGLPPDQRLPETLGGFPVDVRQADQLQQARRRIRRSSSMLQPVRVPRWSARYSRWSVTVQESYWRPSPKP